MPGQVTDAPAGTAEDPPVPGLAEDQSPGADVELPPEMALVQRCAAYLSAGLFLYVGELGIPELLADGPRSVGDLAREVGADPDTLYRVLRMLAADGVFSEVSPRMFRQTPASEALRIMRFRRLFLQLPRMLQTGENGMQLAFGMSFFEYLDAHPAESALFNRAQAFLHAPDGAAVVAAYDWSGVGRVLDVGGGTGTVLGAILAANPAVTGVLFEREVVVADTRETLARRGLAQRCEVVPGDFLRAIPPAGADVIILCHIIHDWDDEGAVTILRNARAVMRPGDRLLIVDAVVPPGDVPHPSKAGDVMMLAFTGGRERTAEEYRALLGSAGLRLTRVIALPPTYDGSALVEAVVAA
jgi:SAM-dependent methyltransferase